MECRARDWHDILNCRVANRRRKKSAQNGHEKRNYVKKKTTNKMLIKNFRIFDHEKQSIEKIAKLLSHSIYIYIYIYILRKMS